MQAGRMQAKDGGMMLQTIYCRSVQAGMALALRLLPWRQPQCLCGAGAVLRVPELLAAAGLSRPLLVTGPHIAASGLLTPLCAALEAAGFGWQMFCAVESDPREETVERIRDAYQAAGCDALLAVGGGSPLDAAKAAGALLARPGRRLAQMYGTLRIRRPLPPLCAVPTTAGSGSEQTAVAVIRDAASGRKVALFDLCLLPRWAVLDPDLLAGLPQPALAAAGMDALAHAVEAFLCRMTATRRVRAQASHAAAEILQTLEPACHGDAAARARLLVAASEAGAAFTRSGVGYAHALAHALGSCYGIAHGRAVAACLPPVLAYYGTAAERPLAALAAAAGIACGEKPAAAAQAFRREVAALGRRLGLPAGFACIRQQDLPQLAAAVLAEAHPLYAVPRLLDRRACQALLQALAAEGGQTAADSFPAAEKREEISS